MIALNCGTCPICSGTESSPFLRRGRQLLICHSCRHVFWEQFPSVQELGAYYASSYTQHHSQEAIQSAARNYYRSHLEELLTIAGRRASDTAVLDYGCSIPVLLAEAQALGFRDALGVDYAEESKAWGSKRGVSVISPGELAAIHDESIDIARFSHTLEHSIDPCAVLKSVVTKLRPGGLIYITQPNFPVFRCAPLDRDLSDTVYPEHLHFFSPLSLAELVRRCGLSIRRLLSVQNEDAVVAKYRGALDLDYAKLRLAEYATAGDGYFSELCNYPYYAGENSVLYALRPGA